VEKTVENHGLYRARIAPGRAISLFLKGETTKSLDFIWLSSTHFRQSGVTLTSQQAKVSEILTFSSVRGGQ
jgi:hypothetical protein